MIRLFVDTALLAIPNLAGEVSEASKIIDSAIALAQFVNGSTGVELVLSQTVEDTLWGNNCAPDFENVGQFLEIMGLQGVFSSRDIVAAYQAILERSVRTDTLKIPEARDVENFNINPRFCEPLYPIVIAAETSRAFMTTAIAPTAFALGIVPGAWLANGEVSHHVTGEITTLVGESYDCELPLAVARDVHVVRDPLALISPYWGEVAWKNAESLKDLHFAIALNALVLSAAGIGSDCSKQVKSFSVGPGFLKSLADWQALPTGKFGGATIDLCAKLIVGACNRHLRHMHNANGKILRKHDGARAMRVHLTDGHEGLRLLYWDNGETFEFANVGDKDELFIFDGGPDSSAKVNLDALTD